MSLEVFLFISIQLSFDFPLPLIYLRGPGGQYIFTYGRGHGVSFLIKDLPILIDDFKVLKQTPFQARRSGGFRVEVFSIPVSCAGDRSLDDWVSRLVPGRVQIRGLFVFK